ncbi:unnamed protein product [Rotaria socialis]|uniref:Uncharacterized protein n=3 Tax=Rotaria TaxID=231623 RepID=A0A820ZAZ1_9BILA|nr:unnamed protein product [Rotaria socialis]
MYAFTKLVYGFKQNDFHSAEPKIVRYTNAELLRKSWLPYLDSLTTRFQSLMVHHLPQVVISKVHFVTEYSRVIGANGPATHFWCMRFEGKHLYFKQLAIRSLNFKNPAFTLIKRHQLRQCLMLSNKNYYNIFTETISLKTIKYSQLSIPVQRLFKQNDINQTIFDECKRIHYKNVVIMKQSVFIEKLLYVEEEPRFVYILHLLNIQNTWKAVVEHLQVVGFNEKIWSYEVEFRGTLDLLDFDKFLCILPHGLDIYYVREEEIDGSMLAKLPFDELRVLFPKLKDRVLFTEKLDLLIKGSNSIENEQLESESALNACSKQTFDKCTASQTTASTKDSLDDPLLSSNDRSNDTFDTTSNVDDKTNEDENDGSEELQQNLPLDFTLVSLPEELEEIINENELIKLRGHTNHRRILLNFVFKVVFNTYNILYPKAHDYFLITHALLKALKIPTTDTNAANEWHEAIKQKFKNERRLLQKISPMVQGKKEKFGKGSGRSAKKSEVLSAERKHENMIYVSTIMDECDIEQLVTTMKEGIRNGTIHSDTLNTLWKKTFGYRRLFIRSHTTNEILEKFPGYSYPCLMFEEVKMIENVDIENNVSKLLPRLFDKLPNNSLFIMDLLPIRIIKLLCKQFHQSVSHILVDNEPLVPTPCIKVSNENFELYLDWQVVAETRNPTTALSLLLSLYNVFEVKFAKNNHTSRLLNGVFFQNGEDLGKNLRILLNSWHFTFEDRIKKLQIQTTNTIAYVDKRTTSELQLHP